VDEDPYRKERVDGAPFSDDPTLESKGVLARFLGVIVSPGETFPGLAVAPRPLLPLLLLLALTAVTTVVSFSRLPVDRIINERMEQLVEEGRLTPEQVAQQQQQMSAMRPIMKWVGPVSSLFVMLLLTLAIAGLARLISLVMGYENQFKPLWSVTIYTLLAVSSISSILFLVILFLKPVDEIDINNPLGSNLAALLPLFGLTGLPRFLSTFLAWLDLFYGWKVVLLAIGYATVTKRLAVSTALLFCGGIALLIACGAAAWAAVFG
jgi:hypothetical protein